MAARTSRELSLRNRPLEAHAEPPSRVRVDTGDGTFGAHRVAQEHRVDAVHNADLDETASSLGVFCESGAFVLGGLSVGVS